MTHLMPSDEFIDKRLYNIIHPRKASMNECPRYDVYEAQEFRYVLFDVRTKRFGILKPGANRDSVWYETEELLAATKFDSYDEAEHAMNELDKNVKVLYVLTHYETSI